MTLPEWLSHIEHLHPVSIDMGLERVRQVALRMGLTFSVPVITVAGTNGKGSTCAMLEAILSQAGYKVGLYTSPHLVNFQERCRLQEESVSEEMLVEAFEEVQRHLGENTLTYFEFSTLAILWILSRASLDVVVLEVGLGGRLDAVNVVDADCAVITSVDLDHMDYLGPDRESIGLEKAGIMRAHRSVVISDPLPPQSVLKHAQDIGADVAIGQRFQFCRGPATVGLARARWCLQWLGLSCAAGRQSVAQCQRRTGRFDQLAWSYSRHRPSRSQWFGHG